jgi:hypothetical protein
MPKSGTIDVDTSPLNAKDIWALSTLQTHVHSAFLENNPSAIPNESQPFALAITAYLFRWTYYTNSNGQCSILYHLYRRPFHNTAGHIQFLTSHRKPSSIFSKDGNRSSKTKLAQQSNVCVPIKANNISVKTSPTSTLKVSSMNPILVTVPNPTGSPNA